MNQNTDSEKKVSFSPARTNYSLAAKVSESKNLSNITCDMTF